MSSKWRCRLLRTFFGLTDEYIEQVYEQFFYLQYVGGWSFIEAYNLPVGLRTWFVKRLTKQIETENKAYEDASSGNKNSKTYTVDQLSQFPGLGDGLNRKS